MIDSEEKFSEDQKENLKKNTNFNTEYYVKNYSKKNKIERLVISENINNNFLRYNC